jgi:hypothetical protein
MPQWLTRWESPSRARPKWPASNRNAGRLRFGTVAGFKSEWRPASSRYRGRLRVGIPDRIESESASWYLPRHIQACDRPRRARFGKANSRRWF